MLSYQDVPRSEAHLQRAVIFVSVMFANVFVCNLENCKQVFLSIFFLYEILENLSVSQGGSILPETSNKPPMSGCESAELQEFYDKLTSNKPKGQGVINQIK